MNERHDDFTEILVTPRIRLALHQSELFGDRYLFYLVFDSGHNFALPLQDMQALHHAMTTLIAKVEMEQDSGAA